MKDRVFKAVWVDKRGRMWSVLKGVKVTSARPDDKPYLFAFAAPHLAVAWAEVEGLNGSDRGHVEVWEAEGDLMTMPDPTKVLGSTAITPEFFDAYIVQGVPRGTLFCRSIKLTQKIASCPA
jgi:hypothetical protein